MSSEREMLERIAKLSNAIERQKSINNRGGFGAGRGGYYQPPPYRGRGGNMSLSHRSTVIPPRAPTVYKTNKYINPSLSTKPYIPQHNAPFVNHIQQNASTIPKSRHKQLIINNKGNKTTGNTVVKSVDTATGRKQVAIDGVDFVVKGRKLIRKDIFDSNVTKTNLINNNSTAPKVLIRKTVKRGASISKRRDKNKNMVIGKTPVVKRKKSIRQRDSKGNMVFIRQPEGYVRQGPSGKSLVLNSRKRVAKKPRYCGFYTRYGVCPKANRCPFTHDPNRRAICPKFLQNRCRKQPGTCRLSHSPNPHIMPHCVHFQKNRCSNDACQYIHVKVNKDVAVCRAFAMEGYCPKGLTCIEKHVHVCPEFAETGKCSNANCRLPHVARRTASDANNGVAGVARLGSWFSSNYFHAQKVAKAEKLKSIKEAAASKVWTRESAEQNSETPKEEKKEPTPNEGFIPLFDDSDDDDGWSQYERDSEIDEDELKSLRFDNKGNEEEDGDDEEEEDEEDEEDEEEEENNDESEEEEVNMTEDSDQIDKSQGDEGESNSNSSEEEFYDAVDDDETMEDSDEEEIYEVVSDDNMED